MKFCPYVFFSEKNIQKKFHCNVFEKVMISTQKFFENFDFLRFRFFFLNCPLVSRQIFNLHLSYMVQDLFFLSRPFPRIRVPDWGLPSQTWHWRMQSNHFRRRRRHWLHREASEASAAKRILGASSDENLQIKQWHYLICRFSSLIAPRILLPRFTT